MMMIKHILLSQRYTLQHFLRFVSLIRFTSTSSYKDSKPI